MALKTLDIGAELGKGWELFKENMGLLVVAGIIASLVSVVTCGILGGAMAAGLMMVIKRLVQKDPVKPVSGDVFKGFDFFVQALILFILGAVAIAVLSVIPVLNVLAGIAVGAVGSWCLMFVVFERLSALDAVKKVIALVKTGEFTVPLVMAVIAGLISSLGGLLCCVGGFFTGPIACCSMVAAYDTLFGGSEETVTISVSPEAPSEPPADLRL
jgi:hypothetical protein